MTKRGFTLLELLTVIALIGMVSALLFPALARGRESAVRSECKSNLRQLQIANTLYAAEHGSYVPAAADIQGADLQRWHGARTSMSEPFDGAKGPLVEFLGPDRAIRECTSFHPSTKGFEAGCGGYGYNDRGVGSRSYVVGPDAGATLGMTPSAITRPAETVMFADTAYLDTQGGATVLIEYSFAESYFQLAGSAPVVEQGVATPTIHFRHASQANVVWCDGHVTSEKRTVEFGGIYSQCNLGWFGAADNVLFDPY